MDPNFIAYEEGYNAYWNAHKIDDNIYVGLHSGMATAWTRGYNSARRLHLEGWAYGENDTIESHSGVARIYTKGGI